MDKDKYSETIFQPMKIEETCKKCKFGVIVNPYNIKCGPYNDENGKPSKVVWEGQPCPRFVLAKSLENKN